jgi:hypothetical protein
MFQARIQKDRHFALSPHPHIVGGVFSIPGNKTLLYQVDEDLLRTISFLFDPNEWTIAWDKDGQVPTDFRQGHINLVSDTNCIAECFVYDSRG